VRVKSVRPVTVAYPEPNDNGETRYLTLCRIAADDGTVGWGEAITMWPEACRATERLIEGLSELVLDRDPVENVEIWQDLKARSWWYGYRGGIASFAISAIDIALWDLKGKALGLPLVTLLGGPRRGPLPVIASTHAFHPSIEHEAERHGRYVREQGYTGVKVGMGKRGHARLGYELDRDVAFFRLLRESVGPSADLMMDRGQPLTWGVEHAIRLVNAFEEHGLRWIEEPFEPFAVAALRTLREHVGCLIAGGEREWTAEGYEQIVGTGLVDVVGCDPGRTEGITGAREVLALVESTDLWFNAHAWSSAIVTAASLALSMASPRSLVFELKPIENPMQHELVETPFAHDRDGTIAAPEKPGLGITVREHVVERYRLR
jgi:D-galactarolactone cycloisomerase